MYINYMYTTYKYSSITHSEIAYTITIQYDVNLLSLLIIMTFL